MQSDVAICIATGPSLTQQQVDLVKDAGKVYVVNDAYKIAPWANVLYAADYEWWEYHQGCPEFAGRKVSCSAGASGIFPKIEYIFRSKRAFSFEPGMIALGGNSGYQALNLAITEGARTVILLGYDMQLSSAGLRHFFGEHPAGIARESNYAKWIENFNLIAPEIAAAGIRVINCSPGSALNCFEKANLQDIICK